MTDSRKIQLEVGADTSGARADFKKLEQSADEMAEALRLAGEKGSQGMTPVGPAAEKSAKQIEQATKSISASIERSVAQAKAGARGTADFYEELLRQRGGNPADIKPLLDGLRQVEAAQKAATAGLRQAEPAQKAAAASLDNMGMSAKATAAALRYVPAQFTDIITSLQGGQAPLTVLLQQGGQLKDMFGGVGPAARALGGYVLGMVNPFTLAAAAAGGLAYAYSQGSAEGSAFRQQVILTGGVAGVTAGQLSDMAAAVAGLGAGTQGRAAEVLLAMADSAAIGGANMARFTAAAIELERVGGPAAEETAKAFAELGRAPLEASVKLNASTNFLTTSVIEQIKALEDQGRTVDAARVAQEAYFDAINGRAPEMLASLGYIEWAWLGVKDAIKQTADAALSIGRDIGPEGQIKALRKTLEERRVNSFRQYGSADADPAVLALQKQIELLEKKATLERDAAAAEGDRTKQVKDLLEWRKQGEQFISQQKKLEAELKKARTEGQVLVNAGLITEEALRTRIEAIRAKAADKLKADKGPARELAEQARLLAELSGVTGDYQQDLTRLQAVRAAGNVSEARYLELVTELIAKQPMAKALLTEQAAATAALAKAQLAAEAEHAKLIKGFEADADAIGRQAQALLDEEAALQISAAGHVSLAQALQLVAIARLQEEQAVQLSFGDDAAVTALQREIDKRRELIGLMGGKELRSAAAEAAKSLEAFLDPAKADSFGDALSKAFEGAGNALAKLSGDLQNYARQQAAIEQQRANAAQEVDPAKRMAAQIKLNEASQRSNVALYANMAGAAKGFFKEGSQGYKTLEAAETAFRVFQLGSDLIKGASAAAVAIAGQAQGDPYTAWPRMAAMAAAMAALGFAVSGGFAGGGSTGGDGAPQATGIGTVFGDAQAQSESIGGSIDLLADTAKLQLSTQSGMLAALLNIESNIGGITNLVLRSGSVTGDVAGKFGVNVGTTVPNINSAGLNLTGIGMALGGPLGAAVGYAVSQIPFVQKITNALFGTKTKITGNGLFAADQGLGDIVNSGLGLQDYADVNKTKKFFGIKYSNKNSTQYQNADPVLAQQFGLVFKDFYSAVSLAAGPLGLSLDQVSSRLDGFVVRIGKIDLSGLTGTQIQEKLTAVLGAAADGIAGAAIPGLAEFQKVGEGYFETVIRVASGVETAQAALELLGISAISFGDISKRQGDVAAEVVRQSIARFEALDGSLSSVGAIVNVLGGSADDIIAAYTALTDVRDVLLSVGANGDALTTAMLRGAGGLEALQSSVGSYFDNFFSEAERGAAGKDRLGEQFGKLGIGAVPATREAFRALVEAQDTSTEAGQKLFAQLLGLSDAFAKLVPATASLADNSLAATQKMAEAGRQVLAGLASQSDQLGIKLLTAQGNGAGAAARTRELALADLSRGLSAADVAAATAAYDLIRATEQQIATLNEAAEAAKRAADAEAARTAAIASQRSGLEEQLLQAQGDTAALRQRELAALDPSNRALQERIFALQDEQTAAQALAQTQAAAAQAAEAIAAERLGLEGQLLQAQGNTAELRRRELERLDPANRALQERIWVIEAEKQAAEQAAQAAQQLSQAWKSITDGLLDEVSRIRGLAGGGADSFAAAQAQFALSSAAARSGDQTAAQALPGLARTLLEFGEQQARSQAELAGLRASTAASLEETAAWLAGRVQTPALGVAAPQVQPLVAQAMQAAAAPAGAGSQSMAELLAELRSVRTAGDENARSLSGWCQRTARVLEKWDVDGAPQERV